MARRVPADISFPKVILLIAVLFGVAAICGLFLG